MTIRIAEQSRFRVPASGRCFVFFWYWVGILCLVGCSSEQPSGYFGTTRPKHPPDELWINNGAEPEWIDPNKCSDGNGGDVIFNTFAGLLGAMPDTLEPTYDIATGVESDSSGTRYVFTLRPSKWSDGTELTAHDFEWSWKRLVDPATASKYAIIGFVLRNAEAFNRGAVLVSGFSFSQLEDPQLVERFRAALPSSLQQCEVRASEQPPGVLVFPVGEDVSAMREQLLSALPDVKLDDQRLHARQITRDDVGVRALDDLTLEVELRNPTPYFLNLLSFYTFMPVPRHVIERLETDGLNPDLWTRPEYIVSNGAYVLTEWQFRQHMLFEKNPYYWRADRIPIERVKTLMIESYNTALAMYKGGAIDWPGSNTSLPAEFMDRLKLYDDFRLSPYLGVYFYWINVERPPMDNVKLRQALSLAIDRERICKYVTRGGQIPTADLVPDGLAGYQGLNSPVFDPERARKLLADAGYPGGKGLPPITLIYNTSEGHKQIAVAIQQMWRENLGANIDIENQEWKVYLGRLQATDFQISRMGWIGDYADPNTFLELFDSNNGNNHSNYHSAEFDKLLNEANATLDTQERLAKLREAEAVAMSQQPLIPIYVYTRSTLVKPFLRGIHRNFQDRHLWQYMSIDERWYDEVPSEPEEAPLPDLRLVHNST